MAISTTVSCRSFLFGTARNVQSFGLDGANGTQCVGQGSKLFRARFPRLQAHGDGGGSCFYERGQFPRVKLKNRILKLRLPLRELPSGNSRGRICRHDQLLLTDVHLSDFMRNRRAKGRGGKIPERVAKQYTRVSTLVHKPKAAMPRLIYEDQLKIPSTRRHQR